MPSRTTSWTAEEFTRRFRTGGAEQSIVDVAAGGDLADALQSSSAGTIVRPGIGEHTLTGLIEVPEGVWIAGADWWNTRINIDGAYLWFMGKNNASGVYWNRSAANIADDGFLHVNGHDVVIEYCTLYGSIDVVHFNGGINGGNAYVRNCNLIENVFDIFVAETGQAADSTHLACVSCDQTATIHIQRNKMVLGAASATMAFLANQTGTSPSWVVEDNMIDWTSATTVKNFLFLVYTGNYPSNAAAPTVTSRRNYVRANTGNIALTANKAFSFPTAVTGGAAKLPVITSEDDYFEFGSRNESNIGAGTTIASGVSSHGSLTVTRGGGTWRNTNTGVQAAMDNVNLGGANQPAFTQAEASDNLRRVYLTDNGFFRAKPVQAEELVVDTVPPAGRRLTVLLEADSTTQHTITFGDGFSATGTIDTSATQGNFVGVLFESDGSDLVEVTRWTT